MPCFSPIYAYQPLEVNEKGKRPLKFVTDISMKDIPKGYQMAVPCGKCIGCRLERSRQWALRCVHEAQLYDDNCFITLTFNDEYLFKWSSRGLKLEDRPAVISGSLVKRDFQNFMKRLRREYPGVKIKYFHCGEYGEDGDRPHHHACLFNFRFPDQEEFVTESGSKVWVSDTLTKLWPFGYSYIGDVTFESAAYCARYVIKKWARQNLKGEALFQAMKDFDKNEGSKLAEYVTMSRRPGIGADWIDQFFSDVYPKDFITIRGVKCKPPKYYDLKKELTNQDEFFKIKYARLLRAKSNPDNSLVRLKVRKLVKEKEIQGLRRNYDAGRV